MSEAAAWADEFSCCGHKYALLKKLHMGAAMLKVLYTTTLELASQSLNQSLDHVPWDDTCSFSSEMTDNVFAPVFD